MSGVDLLFIAFDSFKMQINRSVDRHEFKFVGVVCFIMTAWIIKMQNVSSSRTRQLRINYQRLNAVING